MSDATTSRLAARTSGRVWDADDQDQAGYDEQRSGYNLALDHRPQAILAAANAADVAAGIRWAAENGLPVELQATGHGAHRAMDGGLLITTRLLDQVAVDRERGTARISAGATAGTVLAATAPHGLAAPVGAAPGVGFVSYGLGGGLGMFGRRYGFGADRIRALDVVTADGHELTVSAEHHPELFWGLRGGGGNLAAVTAVELSLLPFAELYGGGLFFDGDQADEVVEAFRACVETAPRELSLSVAFMRFPPLPTLPPVLSGQFRCHVRVAYLGDPDDADRLIAPLLAVSPLLDTVAMLPVTQLGTIHSDPTAPTHVDSDSLALDGEGILDRLPSLLDADAPIVVELRHLGGALAEEPESANAVGHRSARLNLFTAAFPGTDPAAAAVAQQPLYDAAAPDSAGGPLRTFLPGGYPDATSCYEPAIATRLAELKSVWDPEERFRFAPAVLPRQ